MKDMSSSQIVLLVILGIVLFISVPILLIESINVLVPSALIALNLKTWSSSFFLIALFGSRSKGK